MARRQKEHRVKDRIVSFRLSAEEHFRLMDKAHRSGLTAGEFARARSIGGRPRRPSEGLPRATLPAEMDLAIQLRKIGVNLNQIAHHCNRYQVPPPLELEPLLRDIRRMLLDGSGPAPG